MILIEIEQGPTLREERLTLTEAEEHQTLTEAEEGQGLVEVVKEKILKVAVEGHFLTEEEGNN